MQVEDLRTMRPLYDELFSEIFVESKDVFAKRNPNDAIEYGAFIPCRGNNYIGELMVVGRAPFKGPQLSIGQSFPFEEMVEASVADGKCPLDFVTKKWQVNRTLNDDGKKPYSTGRSAFWRIVRNVCDDVLFGGRENRPSNWASSLVWSDLYKFCQNKRNPTKPMRKAVRDVSKRMLMQEVELWKPQRLLFLTGYGWCRDFVDALGETREASTKLETVEWSGTCRNATTTRIVVAPHPQGKSEKTIASAVVKAFRSLRNRN